jgi:hypothetical protein
LKLAREAEGGTHGTDSVRAGRSDADFEEFEEAGVHDLVHCNGLSYVFGASAWANR